MNARLRRIASDYEQIKKDFSNHKYIVVEPIGEEPAEKYRVTYYVNGIYLLEDGRIETLGKHIVIINLHAEYPRYKPICTIATPIWHPNFRDGQICIGDIWGAGESLSDIIVNIGDMIQYKSWNSFSPLSADAAEWAIENKHLFPVGNLNLWTGEEEDGTVKPDFDIDLFDEESSEKTAETKATKPEQGCLRDKPKENEVAEQMPQNTTDPGVTVMLDNQGVPASVESGNDFDITPEELAGIEFVPTAARMQGSSYGATAKGKRLNFKTVLVKGLLWALIGALLGFGVAEVADPLINESAVAKMMGEEELGDYFYYSDKGDKEFAKAMDEYEKWCKENGYDSDDDYFVGWASGAESEHLEKWLEYEELGEEALDDAVDEYWDEHEYDDDKEISDGFTAMVKNIIRIGTALWSAVIAMFIGLFLGIGEGVYYGSKEKAVKYALIGAGIAIVAGAVSGYFAQWMYSSMINNDASDITKALVRGLGWAIMGAGIGVGVGCIKPEPKRIAFCTLGGTMGAFIGGFLFNYITKMVPNDIVARGVAIIIMGLLIGVGVGILEQFAKSAWLKVIRGEFEGKEYLVFEGLTSIGNSGKNTIVLFKDKLVAPYHCDIVQEGNRYVLVDKGSPMGTVVNGMRITRHVLKQGDAIAIGNSVLIFNTK